MPKKLLAVMFVALFALATLAGPARAFTITGDPSGWNYQGPIWEVLCQWFKVVNCKPYGE